MITLANIIILVVAGALICRIIYKFNLKPIIEKTYRYEKVPVKAKVCQKEHKEPFTNVYTTMSMVGQSFLPNVNTEYHAEEYNVYLEYENEVYCIISKELYESVNEGEEIEVFANKGYNRTKNKLKKLYLTQK